MTSFQTRQLGKYIILDQIAVGGMAELFRAMITSVQGFEKLIAIKKILPHLASEENLVSSFIDEAKLAALLHHQNIVQIYDFGNLDESYFIAMEYLLGKDCRVICSKAKEKNSPIGRQNALFIVSRICAGLDYAHKLKDFQGKALNIIHRDISPQNILITYEGDVKIVDFGIAKAASQNTHTQMGMIKGKMAYMSPEQALGKAIDHRSDIFSCGIILYELLTGTRMFSGDTMHILAKIRDAEYDIPEEIKKDIPEQLLKVLDKSLQKEPDDRYQTCGEMLNDLEECMQLGTHPSPQGLAKYMKTLFAEEIAAEEQHLKQVAQIGLQQDKKKQPVSSKKKDTQDTKPLQTSKHNATQVFEGLSGTIKDKKQLFTMIGAGVVLSIIFLVFIFQKDVEQPAPQPQITAETQPDQIPVQQEVSFEEPPVIVEEQVETPAEVVPESTIEQDEAVAETPPSPGDEIFENAMGALIDQRFKEAISQFEELLNFAPEMNEKIELPYAKALVGYANSVSETDPQQAISFFNKAIQVEPGNEQAHFQLGMVFMKQENYEAAVESYKNVIEINPEFPDTFFNLGFINALSKDYTKAEEMYARVVELNPIYVDEALYNLALVQSKLDKKDESLINLEKAVEVNPDNELAQNYLKKLKGAPKE